MRTPADVYDRWLAGLTLAEIEHAFAQLGCTEVLVRGLTDKQGNSKQQIYAGQDFIDAAKIPTGDLTASTTTSTKPGAAGKTLFQAPVDLWWLSPGFVPVPAPQTKLIYYPQYPEVRLSGFLRGSPDAPASLLSIERRGREFGRVLLLAPTQDGRLYGLVLPPEAVAAASVQHAAVEPYGPFRIWRVNAVQTGADTRSQLLQRLADIHRMGWLEPVRLTREGTFTECRGTNCGGYTLEAHVGVTPNGIAEPDYLGWELKAHLTRSIQHTSVAGVLTLMTPEPDGGPYATGGVEAFIQRHGYQNSPDRWDFGGVLRVGAAPHHLTGATLHLEGYRGGRDFDAAGAVQLIGRDDSVIASWSFLKLLSHWRRKHAHTAFVPYEAMRLPTRAYYYGTNVWLAEEGTFPRLLAGFAAGLVYYDPGINLKLQPNGTWKSKRRSQFRAKAQDLPGLYERFETVDVTS